MSHSHWSRAVLRAMPCFACLLTGSLTHAALISFEQLDWLDGAGGYVSENSDWGQVNLQLTADDLTNLTFDDPVTGGVGYYGYLNLVTAVAGGGDNWAVRNLPVVVADAAAIGDLLPSNVTFDLGVTPGSMDVTTLDYRLTFNAAPLGTLPVGGATQTIAVASVGVLLGGMEGTLDGESFSGGTNIGAPAPAGNFVGAREGETLGEGARGDYGEGNANLPKPLSEEKMGCGPASAARSLKYLANIHDNVRITDDIATIYGELKTAMSTDIDGTGTTIANFLSGKNKYTDDNDLPISTEQTIDWDKAFEAIRNKGDVEMVIAQGKKKGDDKQSAHAMFVGAIRRIVDADGKTTGYMVWVLHDKKQGDGKAEDTWGTLAFNADGTLRVDNPEDYDKLPKLKTFQIETVVPEPSAGLVVAAGLLLRLHHRRRP